MSADLLGGGDDRLEHRAVQRVVLVGPGQGDQRDVVGDLDADAVCRLMAARSYGHWIGSRPYGRDQEGRRARLRADGPRHRPGAARRRATTSWCARSTTTTLAKGIGKIEKQLARAVEKGGSTQEDADAVRGADHGTTDYGDLADCDLVIEAITEDLELKLEMWREVDGIVKPEAIFATNTSSLAVIDQAAATTRPERFLGLHYFNPAQVMKLVEVIRA